MTNHKTTERPNDLPRLIAALSLVGLVPLILLLIRIGVTESGRYSFLGWNLFLAIVPLLLAWWLIVRIRQFGWLAWPQLALTFVWIVFLPNSFYITTDLIHLARPNFEAPILFDASLILSFVLAGLIYGFMSVLLVHREIVKRFNERYAYLLIGFIFLAVSFAIFLGRYTRWNTWDILLRPAGLLFDVSDRVINPSGHLDTYQSTSVLFLLLFSAYIVIWEAARLAGGRKT